MENLELWIASAYYWLDANKIQDAAECFKAAKKVAEEGTE